MWTHRAFVRSCDSDHLVLNPRPVAARGPKRRTKVLNTDNLPSATIFAPGSWLGAIEKCRKLDTSGIEPDPSRKPSKYVLSERDNQLHHVPSGRFGAQRNSEGNTMGNGPDTKNSFLSMYIQIPKSRDSGRAKEETSPARYCVFQTVEPSC